MTQWLSLTPLLIPFMALAGISVVGRTATRSRQAFRQTQDRDIRTLSKLDEQASCLVNRAAIANSQYQPFRVTASELADLEALLPQIERYRRLYRQSRLFQNSLQALSDICRMEETAGVKLGPETRFIDIDDLRTRKFKLAEQLGTYYEALVEELSRIMLEYKLERQPR